MLLAIGGKNNNLDFIHIIFFSLSRVFLSELQINNLLAFLVVNYNQWSFSPVKRFLHSPIEP